jgi:hypothetical protein
MIFALIGDGPGATIVACPTDEPILAAAPTRAALEGMARRITHGPWVTHNGRRLFVGPLPFRDVSESPKAKAIRTTRRRARRVVRATAKLRRMRGTA